MAKDAVVSEEFASKFKTEKETPYTRWVKAEGLDIIPSFYVPEPAHGRPEAVGAPRRQRGFPQSRCFAHLERLLRDGNPPGKSLAPHRQLYEEMIMVLSGRGSTTVWNDAGARITFEWKEGALFAIPLNCHHQHFNGSGKRAGALRCGDQCAADHQSLRRCRFHLQHQIRLQRSLRRRARLFQPPRASRRVFYSTTNFVPDAVNIPLITATERGAGGGHIRFNMAKGSMNSHISQFPIGTYKKAHAHGPGAHVIVLSGEGYSLMWPEGEEPQHFKWEVGTMIVPPNMWLHQHFNSGSTPARYLAFKHEGVAIRNAQGVPKAWISRRTGGDQLDYIDEKPEIRRLFATELAKHGSRRAWIRLTPRKWRTSV